MAPLRCPYCEADIPNLRLLRSTQHKRCPGCGERVWKIDATEPPIRPSFVVDADTSGHGP